MAITKIVGFGIGDAALEGVVTGSAACSEEAARGSKYGLSVEPASGSSNHHFLIQATGTPTGWADFALSTGTVGFAFRIVEWGDASTIRTIAIVTTTDTPSIQSIFSVKYDPATSVLKFYNASGTLVFTSDQINRTWHYLEFTYSRAASKVTIWLDGVKIADQITSSTSSRIFGRLYLGTYGDAAAVACVVHFADLYIDGTALTECHGPDVYCTYLFAHSAGDDSGFSGSVGDVRNVPPAADAAGNYSSSPAAISWAVETASEVGINRGELLAAKIQVVSKFE